MCGDQEEATQQERAAEERERYHIGAEWADAHCLRVQVDTVLFRQKVDLTKYIEESVFNFDHVFDETSQNQQVLCDKLRFMQRLLGHLCNQLSRGQR